jgi:hypothetical protein
MSRMIFIKFSVTVMLLLGVAFNTPTKAWGAPGSSSAQVVVPLEIQPDTPLSFGFFTAGTGGTITVFPNGVLPPQAGGDVTIMSFPANSQGRGTFNISGELGRAYIATGDATVNLISTDPTPGIKVMSADLLFWSESLDLIGVPSVPGVMVPQPNGNPDGDVLGVAGTLNVPNGVYVVKRMWTVN